ncbi:MAG: hypothetical protein HQK50_09330 [Oligoflexia bacterium]|nr:hypothetical protein [Oligoflexia bacterium]
MLVPMGRTTIFSYDASKALLGKRIGFKSLHLKRGEVLVISDVNVAKDDFVNVDMSEREQEAFISSVYTRITEIIIEENFIMEEGSCLRLARSRHGGLSLRKSDHEFKVPQMAGGHGGMHFGKPAFGNGGGGFLTKGLGREEVDANYVRAGRGMYRMGTPAPYPPKSGSMLNHGMSSSGRLWGACGGARGGHGSALWIDCKGIIDCKGEIDLSGQDGGCGGAIEDNYIKLMNRGTGGGGGAGGSGGLFFLQYKKVLLKNAPKVNLVPGKGGVCYPVKNPLRMLGTYSNTFNIPRDDYADYYCKYDEKTKELFGENGQDGKQGQAFMVIGDRLEDYKNG